jgi:hypothetical protein
MTDWWWWWWWWWWRHMWYSSQYHLIFACSYIHISKYKIIVSYYFKGQNLWLTLHYRTKTIILQLNSSCESVCSDSLNRIFCRSAKYLYINNFRFLSWYVIQKAFIFVVQFWLFKSCKVSCSLHLVALTTFHMIEHANVVFHSLSRFDHHIYMLFATSTWNNKMQTDKHSQENLAYNMFRKIIIIYRVHFIFSMRYNAEYPAEINTFIYC